MFPSERAVILGAVEAGADPGGRGVLGVRIPSFGGPPNLIKRGKTLHTCARMGCILVLNSYADPPFSKILYPPLYRRALEACRRGLLLFLLRQLTPVVT